jgi:hypothetical protein
MLRAKKYFIFAGTFVLASLVGCKGPSTETSSSVSDQPSMEEMESFLGKIKLDTASIDDLRVYEAECPGNGKKDKKICITICHVPPGNPANARSKVLPLQAIKAHLGHGDYLGDCGGQPPVDPDPTATPEPTADPTPTPVDNPGDDVGNPSPTPETTPEPTESPSPAPDDTDDGLDVIPEWCKPFVEFDMDCDGFNDNTGESYF